MAKRVAEAPPLRKRKRRPNPRLVKTHSTYTFCEAALKCNVHKNTVRAWVREGLPTMDTKRPYLIHGGDLREFLEKRRSSKKRTCKPGQLYCLRCREPKFPAGKMAEFKQINEALGSLFALCPDCTSPMNRRMNQAQLGQIPSEIEVTLLKVKSHISKSVEPHLNSHFR